jgi:hypothetical protein
MVPTRPSMTTPAMTLAAYWRTAVFSLVFGTAACRADDRVVGQAAPNATSSKTAASWADASPEALIERLERESDLACEISYELTSAAVRNGPDEMGAGRGVPRPTLAPKNVFMDDCHRFPPTVQKCLVDVYAFARNEQCEEARRAYDFENQRRFGKTNAVDAPAAR